jgi:hypothetical protein
MEIVFLLQYNLYRKKYEKYNKLLFSSALPRKIVVTMGTIKVLLPSYPVNKCIIFSHNISAQHFIVEKKQKQHVIKVLFTGRWIVICAIHRWIVLFRQIEWNYGNGMFIAIKFTRPTSGCNSSLDHFHYRKSNIFNYYASHTFFYINFIAIKILFP